MVVSIVRLSRYPTSAPPTFGMSSNCTARCSQRLWRCSAAVGQLDEGFDSTIDLSEVRAAPLNPVTY